MATRVLKLTLLDHEAQLILQALRYRAQSQALKGEERAEYGKLADTIDRERLVQGG